MHGTYIADIALAIVLYMCSFTPIHIPFVHACKALYDYYEAYETSLKI